MKNTMSKIQDSRFYAELLDNLPKLLCEAASGEHINELKILKQKTRAQIKIKTKKIVEISIGLPSAVQLASTSSVSSRFG